MRFEDCCSERMETEKLLQISEFQSGNREILQAARLPLTSTYIQNSFCCPQLLRLMPDWDGYGSGPRMLPATPPAAVGGGFPTSSDNFCGIFTPASCPPKLGNRASPVSARVLEPQAQEPGVSADGP